MKQRETLTFGQFSLCLCDQDVVLFTHNLNSDTTQTSYTLIFRLEVHSETHLILLLKYTHLRVLISKRNRMRGSVLNIFGGMSGQLSSSSA